MSVRKKKIFNEVFCIVNILIMFMVCPFSYAIDDVDPTKNPEYFKPGYISPGQEYVSKTREILGVIRNVGILISVLALMLIGIKAMFGSVEEKSEYKQSLVTYVIGVIILAAVTIIPDAIYNIAINL